jgi:hypothetical protein
MVRRLVINRNEGHGTKGHLKGHLKAETEVSGPCTGCSQGSAWTEVNQIPWGAGRRHWLVASQLQGICSCCLVPVSGDRWCVEPNARYNFGLSLGWDWTHASESQAVLLALPQRQKKEALMAAVQALQAEW